MSAESEEVLEAPNWLNELEEKRHRRLKARLGHEAGAGAPCLTCNDKCPGLDLHFWRKICKSCKCSKENHDVHDDDIYGWAQFQLLGSKPNRIKKKITLPGKNDEVELEWTPKGHTETVDRFLKTVPSEFLPVKGSAAAQNRKQLLQKQIPIHDIDPSLCHDLTESELKQMMNYIEHVKSNSVGVGQIVQFGLHRGNLLVIDRYPSGLSNIESVDLKHPESSKNLSVNMDNLTLSDQNELNAFFDTIPNPSYMTSYSGNINRPSEINRNLNPLPKSDSISHGATINPTSQVRNPSYLPHYDAETHAMLQNELRNPTRQGNIRDLAYSTFHDHQNFNNLPPYNSETCPNISRENVQPNLEIGSTQDVAYNPHYNEIANNEQLRTQQGYDQHNSNNLPLYTPQNRDVPCENLSANKVNVGGIRDIVYDHETPARDVKTALRAENHVRSEQPSNEPVDQEKKCRKCLLPFKNDEFAILIDRSGGLYHSDCFKCAGCNQSLADMVYFFDKESGDVYCGRDYAKIRGIPRCKACDELIFLKEYCLAENSTFHVKHFCCFECDEPLAGQNYVMEGAQPVCLPCEKRNAEMCTGCNRVIQPDEQGCNLNGVHFHATDECFACKVCNKALMGAKLLLRNRRLYCSHACFNSDQE